MKRVLLRIGLFLVLGAIVNVAVAWGLLLSAEQSWGAQLRQPAFPRTTHRLKIAMEFGFPIPWLRSTLKQQINEQLIGDGIVLRTSTIRPGFAVNTIFYATILWTLFAAPGALRRRRRLKRGLCPACAYPIGTSSVCTECGTQLHSASR